VRALPKPTWRGVLGEDQWRSSEAAPVELKRESSLAHLVVSEDWERDGGKHLLPVAHLIIDTCDPKVCLPEIPIPPVRQHYPSAPSLQWKYSHLRNTTEKRTAGQTNLGVQTSITERRNAMQNECVRMTQP
jgi:hypothetical protein